MEFDWKEIKEKMKELVRIDKSKAKDNFVKIVMIGADDIREDQMVGKMLQGEEQIKQVINQFVGEGEEIECDILINEEEKYMKISFDDKQFVDKTHAFFEELFFGDFLKKMVEQMMEAMKGMQDAFQD